MTGVASPSRWHIAAIVLGFALLYGVTADWGLGANMDATAAGLPAWSVATSGSIALDDFARANPWMLDTDRGLVSNRPPGVWLVAVPAYLLVRPEIFTNVPATATAISMTIGALVVLYLVLCRLFPATPALVGTVVFGAGTSTWQFSADALWPHGPGQLWAALAILGLASQSMLRVGWAMAAAILTRPLTAVFAAVIGIVEGWRTRSLGTVMAVGLPSLAAVVGLLAYNWWVFGGLSITGGYPSGFTDRLSSEPFSSHVANLFAFFGSYNNGIFVWSPILLIAVVGVVRVWSSTPAWARSAAVAALVYIVVHARLNRASGGVSFGYRYPLEPLMLAAPLLMFGAMNVWEKDRIGPVLIILSATVSIAFQVFLVTSLQCYDVGTDLGPCGFFGP